MFKLDQGFQIELNAWTDRKLRRIAAFSIVLGLEIYPNSRIQFEMRVNFWKKLNVLSASRQACETNEKCPSPKRLLSSRHLSRHPSGGVADVVVCPHRKCRSDDGEQEQHRDGEGSVNFGPLNYMHLVIMALLEQLNDPNSVEAGQL
jgi:hypothetical protein